MKNSIIITGILIAISVFAYSCKTKADTASVVEPQDEEIQNIIMTTKMTFPHQKATFEITNLRMKEDILAIDVTYSGSREHDWELYGNKFYMKSLPPKLGLSLVHDAGGDESKKRQSKTLYFNVKETRYPGKDKDYSIIFTLNRTDKTVEYKY